MKQVIYQVLFILVLVLLVAFYEYRPKSDNDFKREIKRTSYDDQFGFLDYSTDPYVWKRKKKGLKRKGKEYYAEK